MATSESKRYEISKVHIGTMGWSYAFWVGTFYPAGLKPEAYLAEYSRRFNSVEIDNTFYRIPSANTVKRWEKQTPEGFLFSVKFPKVITHVKMLLDCEKEVHRFISSISQLDTKVGPLLLQFPSTFKPEHFSLLQDFLSALPKNYRYAVEIRNKDLLGEELYSLLRETKVALVVADQSSIPSVHEIATEFAYIRWQGDRKRVTGTSAKVEVDRTEEINSWAQVVKRLLDHKVEVFGYFSKYYSGYPPADVEQLLSFFNTACN